jgi:hypothetical protein
VNYLQRFKVSPGTKVKLKEVDPSFKDGRETHESAVGETALYQKKLSELRDLVYAERKRPQVF